MQPCAFQWLIKTTLVQATLLNSWTSYKLQPLSIFSLGRQPMEWHRTGTEDGEWTGTGARVGPQRASEGGNRSMGVRQDIHSDLTDESPLPPSLLSFPEITDLFQRDGKKLLLNIHFPEKCAQRNETGSMMMVLSPSLLTWHAQMLKKSVPQNLWSNLFSHQSKRIYKKIWQYGSQVLSDVLLCSARCSSCTLPPPPRTASTA